MAPRILYGHDAEVSAWVSNQIFGKPDAWEHGYAAIGIMLGVELIGGVVYSGYCGHDIMLSIATTSPKWCTRVTLGVILRYPFVQLGVPRASLRMAVSNERSQSLVERLGFKKEGLARLGWLGTEDALLYGATRPDVERWL